MSDDDRLDSWVSSVLDTYGERGGVVQKVRGLVTVVAVTAVLIGLVAYMPQWAGLPGLFAAVILIFVGGSYAILRFNS